MTRGPRLVVLGKQGAGKGTQASWLAKQCGIPHLSTGDLFRAEVKEGTPQGLEVERHMKRGELVPDGVVVGVIEEQFRRGVFDHGFVLDGFPRTEHQAIELDRVLDDQPLDVAVVLDVTTEAAVARLAGRMVCEECGTVFHVDAPPKRHRACDECGGNVARRADDAEAAIERRLELYERETMPIVAHYRRGGRLVVVDGLGTVDEVADRLGLAIQSRLGHEMA